MATATNLGFPRIGPDRELKEAVEGYWAGRHDADELARRASDIRRENRRLQRQAGLDHVPSNDFSLYDHVLDTIAMVGAVPERYGWRGDGVDLDTYFAMARGTADGPEGEGGQPAMEMTKWFDTNYHYIVPEFSRDQRFRLASTKPVEEFEEAKRQGVHTRPVLLGPVSFLLLGKTLEDGFEPLSLLDDLLPVYEEVLRRLEAAGADWVQLDEPFLGLELQPDARTAHHRAYRRLREAAPGLDLLLAVYFSEMRENLDTAASLPVSALHLDLVRGDELDDVLGRIPQGMSLSLGVVDGRNVWRTDLRAALGMLEKAADELGTERVLVAPSSSLLHSPVDLDLEPDLDDELRSWMAFATQKVHEVGILARALNEGRAAVEDPLSANERAIGSRRSSPRTHDPEVREAVGRAGPTMLERARSYAERRPLQRESLPLPSLPTTTVGSFPQTGEIRRKRAAHRRGELRDGEYGAFIRERVEEVIRFQEDAGLDVLVHGEPERNDMVEFFAEQLQGFAGLEHGWVQSYGSRCVKPPVIYGDVKRTGPLSVELARFAQSLTDRPVKGMLTGPVTMLQWAFVRDDQPRAETARQIALAIRDEVADLEEAGMRAIQIDEPALREGLPLREGDWSTYLRWAVDAFRLASAVADDATQIHTHMCYAEFNDIIGSIAELDADVISLEASRSRMELLDSFVDFEYPNEIGPGVYDIHSPRVPSIEEMEELIGRATRSIPRERLWVNPDCGLKTRAWEDVAPALRNMVEAAERARRTVREGAGA